jgi:hypothetical protein
MKAVAFHTFACNAQHALLRSKTICFVLAKVANSIVYTIMFYFYNTFGKKPAVDYI